MTNKTALLNTLIVQPDGGPPYPPSVRLVPLLLVLASAICALPGVPRETRWEVEGLAARFAKMRRAEHEQAP